MFDCVLPTRLARNGTAFTASGTLNLKNAQFAFDTGPIEESCTCPGLPPVQPRLSPAPDQGGGDPRVAVLISINLHFYLDLMSRMRNAILNGSFATFRQEFVAGYAPYTPAG